MLCKLQKLPAGFRGMFKGQHLINSRGDGFKYFKNKNHKFTNLQTPSFISNLINELCFKPSNKDKIRDLKLI